MIEGGIEAFAGRNVLLLQGPVGPFFARFAHDLKRAGARVCKINFNGGDQVFYQGAIAYRGTMEAWPAWLAERVAALGIDLVVLFGDCRPIHRAAHAVATAMGIEVGVFEEGYLRPDFITLERHGVNGNSPHRFDPDGVRGRCDCLAAAMPVIRPVPRSFWPMVVWGFVYFTVTSMMRWRYPHYTHHRPITFAQGWPWLRSPLRKAWYAVAERGMTERMTGAWSGRFFLVPLQVHNDAQVHSHADTGGVPGFIEHTIASFARAAPPDTVLVFKHHPMDRGYCDYTRLIRRAAQAAGCAMQVVYIHDQHMPTILPHCRGVVVINSTAGLAAVGCDRPTKTIGAAVYDIPGLTFQGSLDRFWTEAPSAAPDRMLYERYRDDLIVQTQINGSFYCRLDKRGSAAGGSATGLVWAANPKTMSKPQRLAEIVPLRGQSGPTASALARRMEHAQV